MKRRFGFSLKAKFILAIALITLLTSLLLAVVAINRQHTLQKQAMRSRTIALATTLANNAEQAARDRMTTMLTRLATNTIKEEDVLYAVIYDNLGNVLVQSFIPDPMIKSIVSATPPSRADIDSLLTLKLIENTFRTKTEGDVMEVIVPIVVYEHAIRQDFMLLSDEPLSRAFIVGVVRMGVTTERMREQINRSTAFFTLVTLGIVIFGIFISVIFVRMLLKPVNELSVATKRISSGDLNYRVPITSNDELGSLALSFNSMAQELKDHVDELNKEKEDLITLKIILEHRSKELEETLDKIQGIQQELLKSEKFATIGRLSSTVAHELRNPLASLKNISYYLSKTGAFTDPKAKKMLEILSSDVARANKIITDLLDYSRSKKLNKVEVSMEEFVKKALTNVTIP
ncbi:MAG: HAMP domain-containing protein, partial [Elusimicrobia bacterium]|nr:HAMP domain-containing protein [Elusimicrobiota bacterium]